MLSVEGRNFIVLQPTLCQKVEIQELLYIVPTKQETRERASQKRFQQRGIHDLHCGPVSITPILFEDTSAENPSQRFREFSLHDQKTSFQPTLQATIRRNREGRHSHT